MSSLPLHPTTIPPVPPVPVPVPPSPAGELRIKYTTLVGLIVIFVVGFGLFKVGSNFWTDETAAPTLTLPTEVKGAVGEIVPVHAIGTATDIRWHSTDKSLHIAGRDLVNGANTILVSSATPGRYTISAHGAKHNKSTDIVSTSVVIGDAPPTPPGPGPTPPGPIPPPTPPNPLPSDKLRVLFLFKSEESLTPAQDAVLRSTLVDSAITTGGGDWRKFQTTMDISGVAGLDQWYKDAIKRPQTGSPSVIISSPKGFYEGVLPATGADTIALINKYKP